jgi:hypothetical protein
MNTHPDFPSSSYDILAERNCRAAKGSMGSLDNLLKVRQELGLEP